MAVLGSPSLIVRMVSVDVIIKIITEICKAPTLRLKALNNDCIVQQSNSERTAGHRTRELCEVEVTVLGSPSLVVFKVSVDAEQH